MLKYKLTVNINKSNSAHDYIFSSSVKGIFELCKYRLLLGRYGYTYDDIRLELINE